MENRTNTYDDFLLLRRTLSYQYGSLSSLHYTLSVPLSLSNIVMNLETGDISILNLPLSSTPADLEPFAVRLSVGFQELFGDNYVRGGCLPAFIATTDALQNPKFNFKSYISLLYQDIYRLKNIKKSDNPSKLAEVLFGRLSEIHEDYDKAIKIWEIAKEFGQSNEVPPVFHYWL